VIEIFREMESLQTISGSDFVFPSSLKGRKSVHMEHFARRHPGVAGHPLGQVALWKFLNKYLGYSLTVHGFRSTFASWAKATKAVRDVAYKTQIDHVLGTKADRAYDGKELLIGERREMLELWSSYCDGNSRSFNFHS